MKAFKEGFQFDDLIEKANKEKAKQNEKDLKHEYNLYIEKELDNIKNKLSRKELVKRYQEAEDILIHQKKKFIYDLNIKIKMDEILKKEYNLPSLEEWKKEK